MRNRKPVVKILSTLLILAGIPCAVPARVMASPPEKSADYAELRNEDMRAKMKDEREEDRIDARATLAKSTDLYSAIVKGAHGQVPESVLAKAQCVAVIPDVMTGALIVGGSHGVGIASCRENNNWSPPAFLKMTSVSLGAQIGAKSSDVVLFMISDKAKSALKNGKITLGTDVSVTAGNFDRNFDTSAHGVIAYTRTEGVFAGASLSGGNLSSDNDDTRAFYGKDATFASLMSGNSNIVPNPLANGFTGLLPR